jgi:hypothetical protein
MEDTNLNEIFDGLQKYMDDDDVWDRFCRMSFLNTTKTSALPS